MSSTPVDWTTTIGVLVTGLVIGAVLLYRLRAGAKKTTASPELELRDLHARRDALIIQLRELEDAAAKLDVSQLSAERARLEIEAARVLSRIDEREGRPAVKSHKPSDQPAAEAPAAAVAPPQKSAIAGFVWGVASTAAVAALFFFVSKSATSRPEGGSMTGTVPGETAGQAPASAPDPAFDALQARVRANPDDIGARIELAEAAVMKDEMMLAFEHSAFVLQTQPDNSRALVIAGFVRTAMGDFAEAERFLRRATEVNPREMDAWVQLCLMYTLTQRMPEAEEAINQAIAVEPAREAELRGLFERMKAHSQPAPAGAGSAATSAPTTPSTASSGGGPGAVVGTIDIEASARSRITQNSVVWVMARAAGETGGAPLAVVRIAPMFPAPFMLSKEHSMMGDELPAKLRIDVRIDNDGDVTTKDPSDPIGFADDVSLGTSGVRIVLK